MNLYLTDATSFSEFSWSAKMQDEATIHFQGIETVAASTDGKFLLFKTLDGNGNPHHLALHSDEATFVITKILMASVKAEQNRGAPLDQTKAVAIYDIRLMVKDAPSEDAALAVTFQSGTTPMGLTLPKSRLASFAEDMLRVLNPQVLASPYTSQGKIPN
jgi:hypothetical protein